MKTIKKVVTIENDNNDNIIWYDDNFFQLEAPCYFSIKSIIKLIKTINPSQNLILNNVLEMTGNYFLK